MAPAITGSPSESLYLSSLDKCFNGNHRLISWKQAHEALSNLEFAKRSPNLRWFLSDEQSINALSADLDPISRPTPLTKSEFEAKTAAVNVTPAQDGHFDIQQIKDDTLWLAKQAELDEISALRIVVLNWQLRPTARILENYAEEELISIQQVVGDPGFGASLLGNLAVSFSNSTSDPSDKPESENARRLGLLRLLLSEREHILEVSYILRAATVPYAHTSVRARTDSPLPNFTDELPWLSEILNSLQIAGSSKQRSSNPENRLQSSINELERLLQEWEAGGQWSALLDNTFSFEAEYRTSQLRRVLSTLRLTVVHLANIPQWASAANVQAWFAFVDRFSFLELLQPQVPEQEPFIAPIQALLSFVSLQIFKLPQAVAHINEDAPNGRPVPYIYDQHCRQQVDETIARASLSASRVASPAILAWSIILQNIRERLQISDNDFGSDDENISPEASPLTMRARSALPISPSGFSAALDSIGREITGGDPIDFYARTATDSCGVLGIISLLSRVLRPGLAVSWNPFVSVNASLTILELARQILLFTSYSTEIVETMLSLLNDDDFNLDQASHYAAIHAALAQAVTKDTDVLVPRLLYLAQQRYPYELGPFLKLFRSLVTPENRSLSPVVKKILPLAEPTNQFTQQLPLHFNDYELVREDENTNGVRLTQDLRLFLPRRKTVGSIGYSRHTDIVQSNVFEFPLFAHIPAGTTGTVVSESKPFIVAWDYRHSAIQYLASLLSSVTPSSTYQDVTGDESLDADVQADIVGFFADLVEAYKNKDNEYAASVSASAPALWVLEEASDGLNRNEDIISVVFEIFEDQLSNSRSGSVDLIISCIKFFAATASVVPGRIWPLLARSELLQTKGSLSQGGKLVTIINSIDAGLHRSSMIAASLSLFDALIDNSLTSSVSLKKPGSTIAKRFANDEQRSTRLPDAIVSNILQAFTRATLSIFEMQRVDGGSVDRLPCLRIFDRLISSVFSCGDGSDDTSNKPSTPLLSSAKLLTRAFLEMDNSTSLRKLLQTAVIESTATSRTSSHTAHSSLLNRTLILITHLLEVSVHYPKYGAQHLQKGLFQSLPAFARLYISRDLYKRPILEMLSNLLRKAGSSEQEPPSLLGSLGAELAKAFLDVLKHLSQPFGEAKVDVEAWNFATVVVSTKQQWFASCLINGDVQKRFTSGTQSDAQNQRRSRSLLTIAMDHISSKKSFDDEQSIAALRFLVQAQSHWSSVSMKLHQHERCINSLMDYVAELREKMSRQGGIDQARQVYCASLIADLMAMYYRNLRQQGIAPIVEPISSKLTFYRENGLLAPSYNSSLHKNLKRNFDSLFTGCNLDGFKRSLGAAEFGRTYFYNLEFADTILGDHQAWNGTKGGGLKEEVARANLNLSVVEAEIALTKSWGSLLTELSYDLKDKEVLQKQMITIVAQCLEQDFDSNLHEAIFEALQQRRIDFALILLQRLVNIRCSLATTKNLLSKAWDAVRNSGEEFETAFADSDSSYYQSTLQVLLLVLQPWTYIIPSSATKDSAPPLSLLPPEIVSILLEITSEVICKGFRSLCSLVHSSPSLINPSDFGILLGLLQVILRIPGISTAYTQLTLRISDTGVHRYALALFSWSDRLVSKSSISLNENKEPPSDPLIYADLSIALIRELSNIPPYAEYLATEGVLSQLSATPLLSQLRAIPSTPQSTARSANALRLTQTQTQTIFHQTRLVTIFSRSILPLTLNLLASVGSSFASEATAFLASFPNQLTRISSTLKSANGPPPTTIKSLTQSISSTSTGTITLSSVAELHTLSLIDLGIQQALDSPSGLAGLVEPLPTELWDRNAIRDEVESWLSGPRRGELAARIVPGSEWEESLMGKSGGSAAGSVLEGMIVRELQGALLALGD